MNDRRTFRQEQDGRQRVIEIRRVTKVTKGGKRLKFRSIVVVGDGLGRAGFGVGKALEVPEAIRKATEKANKNSISIPLKETTIPYEVKAKFNASTVILKPAERGHGMVVGKTMRAFLEAIGVKDVVGKCLNSTNSINVLNATVKALKQLKTEEGTAVNETQST